MKYKVGETFYETLEEMKSNLDYRAKPTGINKIKWVSDPKPLKDYPSDIQTKLDNNEDLTEEEQSTKDSIDKENKQIREDNIEFRYNEYETKEQWKKRTY